MLLSLCWSLIAGVLMAGATDLKEDIAKHVRMYSANIPNVIKVTVNTPMLRLITAVAPLNGLSESLSATNALYTALGCEAANWILDEVYEFVSWSQIFSDSGDDYRYQKDKDTYFEIGFTTLMATVRDKVSQLTGVLDSVLRSADDRSRYADTSVLETLFALQMDMYFLAANLQDGIATQDVAYRVLAADMTAAQKYLASNCANAPPNAINPDSSTFGYWLRPRHGNAVRTLFLSEVLNVMPKLNPQRAAMCKPTHMLLEDFLRSPKDCIVAAVVAKSEIIVQGRIVSMDDAYQLVRTAYDVDTVLWYQESVMAAVVKAVLAEILHGIRRDGFGYVQPYANRIDVVYEFVAPAGPRRRDLPDCLIDGFTFLKAFSRYPRPLAELQKYHDSLRSILSPPPFEQPFQGRDFLLMAFVKIAEHLQPDIGSFECFSRCFECLRNRRDRYHYEPSAAMTVAAATRVAMDEGEGDDENVCKFLAIIHSTCRRLYKELGELNYRWNITGKKFHSILRQLDDARRYVQPIVDKRTWDIRLLRLAYDIISVLANFPRKRSRSEPGFYVTDVQRYLNIIVSALGYAGLRWYCCQPGAPITFHWWYVIGDDDVAASQRQWSLFEFYRRNLIEPVDSPVDPLDADTEVVATAFDPFNVNSIYDAYVAPSRVIAAYENRVLLTWKGWPTTLSSMFWNAVRLPVDTRVLLSLYDSYLTFYVATVCYEIDRISFDADANATEAAKAFHRLPSQYLLKELPFPDSLKLFVTNVVSLLASFTDSAPTDPPVVALSLARARKQIVDEQLVLFGVAFNHSHKVADKIQSIISTLSICTTSKDVLLDERASDFIVNLYRVPPQPPLNQ